MPWVQFASHRLERQCRNRLLRLAECRNISTGFLTAQALERSKLKRRPVTASTNQPVSSAIEDPTTNRNMDPFLQAAIDEANKGLAAGGIPIGSVLVLDGKIIGRGHNQ